MEKIILQATCDMDKLTIAAMITKARHFPATYVFHDVVEMVDTEIAAAGEIVITESEVEVVKKEDLSTLTGNLNDLVSKVTKTGEVRFSALSEEERAKVVAAISQSLSAQGSSVQEPEPDVVEHVEPIGIKPIEMSVTEGTDGITDVEFTIGRAAASIPPEQDTPMGNALRNANRGNRQRGQRQ